MHCSVGQFHRRTAYSLLKATQLTFDPLQTQFCRRCKTSFLVDDHSLRRRQRFRFLSLSVSVTISSLQGFSSRAEIWHPGIQWQTNEEKNHQNSTLHLWLKNKN